MPNTRKDSLPPHPVLPEYYGSLDRRQTAVDQMFDQAAAHYDWITDVMSFGSGRWYRRQALVRAGLKAGDQLLDVGAGTGVVSAIAQDITSPSGQVVALDPSGGMLAQARQLGVKQITQGRGEHLPFADNQFDYLVMSYALRHVPDLNATFAEYQRVLKPGGKVLLLEITRPQSALGKQLLKAYLKGVIPNLARLARRSVDSKILMQYYWDTIESCVPPQDIVNALGAAGFSNATRHVVMGIFSEYSGVAEKQ